MAVTRSVLRDQVKDLIVEDALDDHVLHLVPQDGASHAHDLTQIIDYL